MPCVSVVIPAYNSSLTLSRAIQSVLAQTFRDFEIVVVDDGSVDDTVESLAPFWNCIQYVYQENRGRSAARNCGISVARGRFVAFLDADDHWHPTKLEKCIPYLSANSRIGLVHSAYYAVSGGTAQIVTRGSSYCDSNVFSELLFRQSIGTPSCVVVTAEQLAHTGGFREDLDGTEDWDLWLRIAARSHATYLDNPLAFYTLYDEDPLVRLRRRQASTDWIRIVFDLFEDIEIREVYRSIENRAKAAILFRSGLVDLAVGNTLDCRTKFDDAFALYDAVFDSSDPLWGDLVAEVANRWGRSRSVPVYLALEYIDAVWRQLPPQVRKRNRSALRTIKARVCAERFHDAFACSQMGEARLMGLRTMTLDPAWGVARGNASMFFESVVGSELASRARSVLARLERE